MAIQIKQSAYLESYLSKSASKKGKKTGKHGANMHYCIQKIGDNEDAPNSGTGTIRGTSSLVK